MMMTTTAMTRRSTVMAWRVVWRGTLESCPPLSPPPSAASFPIELYQPGDGGGRVPTWPPDSARTSLRHGVSGRGRQDRANEAKTCGDISFHARRVGTGLAGALIESRRLLMTTMTSRSATLAYGLACPAALGMLESSTPPSASPSNSNPGDAERMATWGPASATQRHATSFLGKTKRLANVMVDVTCGALGLHTRPVGYRTSWFPDRDLPMTAMTSDQQQWLDTSVGTACRNRLRRLRQSLSPLNSNAS